MSNTGYALTGFVSWPLFLLVLMETIRTYFVATRKVAANGFTPDNSGLSPFMQRLARAHANCIEGLPIFGDITNRNYGPSGVLATWRTDRAVHYPSSFHQCDRSKSPLRCFRHPDGNRRLLGVETDGLKAKAGASIKCDDQPACGPWPAFLT